MRLLSFRREDEASFGALIEGKVVDLGRHLPEYDSLRALLAAGALVKALDTAAEVSADHRLDKVSLLPPIGDPERALCVFDEARDEPISINPKFIRGTDQALLIPPGDSKPLAVGLALVPGPPREGMLTVAGVMLVSYLSPGALAMGPWLVTRDELDTVDEFSLTAEVDERSAEVQLTDLRDVITALATTNELAAGDVVAVLHFLPEFGVQDGDRLRVSCEAIGSLENPVATEDQGS